MRDGERDSVRAPRAVDRKMGLRYEDLAADPEVETYGPSDEVRLVGQLTTPDP